MFNDKKLLNDVLYDPTPRYYFLHSFVCVNVDCPRCKESLKFRFSWKEVMNGINKNITKFYGKCSCLETITFNIDKETLQGFVAESVLEAFEEKHDYVLTMSGLIRKKL